jgi:DNA-binding response OmpR family regulator
VFNILLVDDDADVRRIVKKILEKSGYSVVVVDNGLSALDELNTNAYDLLLSDATMPQYSGFDLIRSVRRLPKHDHMSIAMLTGRRDKQDIQQAIDLKVDDYIIKPINPEVLLTKVEKILCEKRNLIPVMSYVDIANVDFQAGLETPLRMTKIGLAGFTAVSPQAITLGTEFYLNIRDLDYENMPKVKISSSAVDPQVQNQYIVEGTFLELDEEFKNEIKKCLMRFKAA